MNMCYKVMVVEDEEILRLGTTLHLNSFGYEVVGNFRSGEEALDHVIDLKPDIILMDIELAGNLDGIETTKKIHEKFDVPVIYLSVHADKKTIELAESTKLFRYMNKPFNEDELEFTIKMAIKSHKNEKLLKKADLYKNFLENIPGIAYRIDLSQNKPEITFFNNMFEQIMGYCSDELSINDNLFLMPLISQDYKNTPTEIDNLVKSGKPFNLKYKIKSKNGDIKSVCENCKPLFDKNNNLSHIDGLIYEI